MAKAIADGFVFNILCVGETACGKSSLLDSLFNTRLDSTPSTHENTRVFLRKNTYELFEREICLKLTVVETAGFGDQINKDDSYKIVGDFIDEQFQLYLDEELKIKRNLSKFHDTRIHVCLYFISPTGHSLKAIDLITMKHLDSKVNIIPIIAKSDTISKNELQRFKQNILNELNIAGVKIYRFPTDDETLAEENLKANVNLKFIKIFLNFLFFCDLESSSIGNCWK
jgi:septin 6/8/11